MRAVVIPRIMRLIPRREQREPYASNQLLQSGGILALSCCVGGESSMIIKHQSQTHRSASNTEPKHTPIAHTHKCMHTHKQAHIFTHTHKHTRIHTHIDKHMHTQIYTHSITCIPFLKAHLIITFIGTWEKEWETERGREVHTTGRVCSITERARETDREELNSTEWKRMMHRER